MAQTPPKSTLLVEQAHDAERSIAAILAEDGTLDDRDVRVISIVSGLHAGLSAYESWRVAAASLERNGPTPHTLKLFRRAGFTVLPGGKDDGGDRAT